LTVLASPATALGALRRAGATPPLKGSAISMKELIAQAKKEGKLNTIALPPDWANYGEIMNAFQKKYGLKITNDNPNGSSADENQAVRTLKGDSRAPDVVDDSPAFAIAGAFSAALANGGSLNDVGPGVDFFAQLKKNGNWLPVGGTPQTVASGQTPVVIDWDYLNLAYTKEFPAANWKVTVPTDGVYGAYYCQAINANAPHPWAARLWEEFL